MTSLFDFRHTFLRTHLARELTRTTEVLSLEELNKIKGARPLTLRDFFYGGLPEDGLLYIPVRVLPLGDDLRGLSDRYFKDLPRDGLRPTFDLSYALAALRHFNIPGGIYLRSRSGAGKTVAGLAALCDCLYGMEAAGAPDAAPRLGGFLPCRLRTGDVFKGVRDRFARFKSDGKRQDWLDKQVPAAGSGLIERMLLVTAGLAGNGRSRLLRGWMNAGPPLLIFVDLNAFGEVERRLTAAALVKFQDESASTGAGHRVVVTYRSATLDGVHTTLGGCRLLHPFDLEPLTPWQAAEYVRTYRRLAARREGTAVSDAALDEEATALRQFIDDHVTDDESLVSTPLLMHLVTLISGPELREGKVRTLSDLYDLVVHRFFEQDFRRTLTGEVPRLFVSGAPGGPEGHFVTAMCRAALAILAGGESNTRLTGHGPTTAKDVLDQLWELPDIPRLWSGGPSWHPTTEWWLKDSPYYGPKAVEFDEAHRKELFRRTLLYEDDGSFRFLHDSFMYYFAAFAVRGYRRASWNHARNDIEGQAHPWYDQTAARLNEAPRVWTSVAEFLGGMLQSREMSELVFRMLIAAPKDGWPTLLIRLLNGRRRTESEDAVLAGIDYALHHKEGMVERLPTALRTEVYHYLRDGAGDGASRIFAERLENAGGCAWLCSVKPTWWPAPVMRAHRDDVTCVGLMPDGCIVSGSDDGRVLLWDSVRFRVQTLIRHQGRVNCLAVSSDGGTVVSGGKDKTVRRWTRQGGEEREPLITHKGEVRTVALSGDGATIVWGSDWAGWRWTRQGGEERRPLITGVGEAVALSEDGTTVVWSSGRQVWRWTRQGGEEREPLITHQGNANAVAVARDGAVVISGGSDDAVRRWTRQGGEEREPLITHKGEVRAVALSGDGETVVSGGHDDAVRCWTRQGGEEPNPLITHEDGVTAVALSGDGETVVSGGEDNVVRRWTRRGSKEPQPLIIHDGGVRAVALSRDGATVVSGGDDEAVKEWTEDYRENCQLLITHDGSVNAVALSGDRETVISGGDDAVRGSYGGYEEPDPLFTNAELVNAVALSDNGTIVFSEGYSAWCGTGKSGEECRRLINHKGEVTAVALSGDGETVVSGGDDNVVRRWTRQGGEESEPLITHKGEVRAVALSGDGGTVVSGGKDDAVRRWTRQGGEEREPLMTHEETVKGVALSSNGAVVVSGGDCTIQCYRAGQGVVCVFLFNSSVQCVAFADAVGRIAVGLQNGEVPILDHRNFPPDLPG